MEDVKKFKLYEIKSEYQEAKDFFEKNHKFPHHSTVFVYKDEIIELMEKYAKFCKNK